MINIIKDKSYSAYILPIRCGMVAMLDYGGGNYGPIGGRLKATLAAILGGDNQPDLLILDEPTNNLEIKSIGILEDALNQYTGAILLVSHDEMFVKNIKTDQEVHLQ